MRNRWILWISIFLGSWISALGIDVSTFGDRPAESIYDPAGWIKGAEKKALARELASIKETSGLDILVVVKEDPQETDFQAVAEELANRWGDYGGRVLIFYEPGNYESPWIAVSGLIRSEVPRTSLDLMIKKAKQRARGQETVGGGVREAMESLGDDLRFASGRAARGLVAAQAKQAPPGLRQTIYFFLNNSKKIIAVVAAGALMAGFLIFWTFQLWKKARKAMFPKVFPEISWKPRFGAPHAGIVYTHSRKPQRHHED